MPIQARTNNPGFFEYGAPRSESRFDERYDINDGYSSHTEVYERSVKTDFCLKSGIQHSDRFKPTSWRREVGTVLKDDPFRFSDKESHSNGNWTASTQKRYISASMGQFAFLPLFKDMDNCVSESVVEALQDLGGQKAQLGADLGQIRQTADMLANAVVRGGEFLRALRRGDAAALWRMNLLGHGRSGTTRGTHTASNLWLEYVYGWKPLAQSIYDYSEVLTMQVDPNRLLTGRGAGKSFGSLSWNNGFDITDTYETSARTVLQAKASSDLLYRLNSLGVTNPLSIAWELVPWSFAVDWFIPVGNTLDALSATLGLDFVRGYTSCRSSAKRTASYSVSWFSSREVIDRGEYIEDTFGFRRTAYDSFPRPSLYADLTPFSTPRVLNALALVRQLFK